MIRRGALVLAAAMAVARAAHAQDVANGWVEPHVALAPYGPPGDGGSGLGVGARGTFVVAPDGLASTLDDSAAVSVGVDLVRYRLSGSFGYHCNRFETAVDGQTQICVDADGAGAGTRTVLYAPVAFEWAVRVKPDLAVTAEVGLALAVRSDGDAGVAPVVGVGVRWRLSERLALAARIGYPVWTVGVALPF